MNPLKAAELLPWLLNRSLGEEEKREILTQLEHSEELRRELAETFVAGAIHSQRIPSEALVDYAMGEPSAEFDRDRIEALLDLSPGAAEELEMIRESFALLQAEDRPCEPPLEATQNILPAAMAARKGVETARDATSRSADAPASGPEGDNVVTGPWSRPGFQKAAALAAGLAIAVLGGGLFQASLENDDLRDALDAERAAKTELLAKVETGAAGEATGERLEALTRPRLVDRSRAAGEDLVRSGDATGDPLVIRRSAGVIERVLVLDRPMVQPLVVLELTDADGETRTLGPQPRDPDYPMDFILSLWAPGLEPGPLSVKVYGMDTPEGERALLREFAFDVRD